MDEFQVIEVKSLWLCLSGRIWRFMYRVRRKAMRCQTKAMYKALKADNKPRIYRVEIR